MKKKREHHLTALPFLLLLLPLASCVHSSPRAEDRVLALLEELVGAVRGAGEGITAAMTNLLSETQQERLERGEQVAALRDHVKENRRALDMLRAEVSALLVGRCPTYSSPSSPSSPSLGPSSSVSEGGGVGREGGVEEAPGSSESSEADNDDTDCPPPYQRFGEYCLTVLQERSAWESARSLCHMHARNRGGESGGPKGDLVVPHNLEDFKAFVTSQRFGSAPHGLAWVGGSTGGWGGVWAWVDGTLLNEVPWVYTQVTQGSFLAVDNLGEFHQVTARENLWAICQYTTGGS